MNQWNNIGQRLRALRKDRAWTLKKVSEKTGLSLSFICDIEVGRTDPSLKTLEKFSQVYKLDLSSLFKGVAK